MQLQLVVLGKHEAFMLHRFQQDRSPLHGVTSFLNTRKVGAQDKDQRPDQKKTATPGSKDREKEGPPGHPNF